MARYADAFRFGWVCLDGRAGNHTIVSQHRQTFRSRVKHIVLLCLGADISLVSTSPHAASNKSNSKLKESLRVTMVHGDIVILHGRKSEARNHISSCWTLSNLLCWSCQFMMVRTGMCMRESPYY